MKPYSRFIFESYSFDAQTGTVELRYSLDGEVPFVETLRFGHAIDMTGLDAEALDRALFALHLAGGASYYKTCLPKTIEIKSGSLSQQQTAFWNALYENGLGEFFYKNDIDFRELIKFPVGGSPLPSPHLSAVALAKAEPSPKGRRSEDHRRVLVPVGGGKDSTVTIELLKKAGVDVTLFRMGGHPVIEAFAKIADCPLLTVERALSKELFALNEQGALNGHVPITAYLSLVAVVTAILTKHDAIALSNERSAEEGNVEFHGKEINHQWSKSLEFERMLQNYVQTWITPDVSYFSLLRSLSELHITKLCAELTPYLDTITSCNANWRILKPKGKERWCGTCPKCAFAFALFAAFLPKAEIVKMFGKNLFEGIVVIKRRISRTLPSLPRAAGHRRPQAVRMRGHAGGDESRIRARQEAGRMGGNADHGTLRTRDEGAVAESHRCIAHAFCRARAARTILHTPP